MNVMLWMPGTFRGCAEVRTAAIGHDLLSRRCPMSLLFRILLRFSGLLAMVCFFVPASRAAEQAAAAGLVPSAGYVQQRIEASASVLDLRKAERLALEQNLDLQAEVFTSQAAEALVRKGYGIYDPNLELFLAEGERRDLSNFQFFVGPTGLDTRDFNLSLTQVFSPGTEVSLFYNNRRQNLFTEPKPAINPEYDTELGFSLTQPLLKNFGRTVTEQTILFAAKDREVSIEELRRVALDLLMEVRSTYFNVLRARDDLAYRSTSVKLARTILEENRARVAAGVLPPVEVLEAEVGVQSRERDRLDAERAYHDVLDQLALLLNRTTIPRVAEDRLGQPEIETDEGRAFRTALKKRPELQALLRQSEKLEIEQEINRNQTLPALDLQASYSHKGVGQNYNDSVDFMPRTDLRNWQIGLNFSYPLGNRAAREELNRTRLKLKSRHAAIGQLQTRLRKEIRQAIRLLEVSRAKISAATIERQLAEEKLRILVGRKNVGLATTRDLLEGEEDLARARTNQIAALADYNIALSGYYRATGELLAKEGIRLQRSEGGLTDHPFTMD
ncbi:hypothetical protein C2E25_15245 [Geothermobacter hydrogeniphilus]|uniref:Outer membrane protein TolC n=2 Tax=Geothermobacter hydrogeniphilus TaxID=1969733 RepID=A0A2K2H6H0_9BACT|nr:hypothetical protein C2E25_15245 [Geothermobacter hydrogeniphilus]